MAGRGDERVDDDGEDQDCSCLMDFPAADGAGREVLAFGRPLEILSARHPEEVGPVLDQAEARARGGAWVVGGVSFDAAPAFDPALRLAAREDVESGESGESGEEAPLAWFAVHAAPLPQAAWPQEGDCLLAPLDWQPWQPALARARFEADVAALRRGIFAGEMYQVNHTLRLQADWPEDGCCNATDLARFLAWRRAQPGGYGAYLDLRATPAQAGQRRIFSLSPELFFRREGACITTRPMKGTVRRGRWAAEDRQLADWLRASEKNRAENLMIVDLLRNDLSRIAEPHGVEVAALFALERHPTVWQMTSTVRARARPEVGLRALFAALFPCGSVTGAPKVRAMEWIARLEHGRRGFYCGSVGLLRPGGDAVFNVAIRTVEVQGRQARCGVGGGITWDSVAAEEYAEALLKARFLSAPAVLFQAGLFETLRLAAGRFERLEMHLERLAASADYFALPFEPAQARAVLLALAAGQATGAWRVRLLLARDGAVTTELHPLPPTPAVPRFALALEPLPRDACWRYHKTTQREPYERALAAGQVRWPGLFDVLLCNEDGELSEFTRGNLVLDIDGECWTPPLDSGLLPGVLRRTLLDSGRIREAVLRPEDLHRARRILFINSLRGEIEVTQVGA